MNDEFTYDPEKLSNILSSLPTFAPGNGVPLSFDPSVKDPEDFMRPQMVQRSLSVATTVNPDAYAKQVQLAKKLGISPDAIPDNEEIAKRAAIFKDVPPDTLSVTNPGVADFLITPHHAKIAQDDVPALSFIDNALKQLGTPGDASKGYKSGQLMVQKAWFDDKVQNGTATQGDLAALENVNYLLEKGSPTDLTAMSVSSQVAGLYVAMQPEAVATAELWGGAGAAVAFALGQTPYTIGLPEEMVIVPAATALFGGAGYRAGLAMAMYRLEGTQAYNESIEAGDPEWRAQVNKFAVGSINAALEMVGFNVLMRPFSPLKKLVQERAAARMVQRLADEVTGKAVTTTPKSIAKGLKKGARTYSSVIASESGIEGLQQIVSESVPEITRAATEAGYSITPERAIEIAEAGVEEALIAAKGMFLLALPGSAVQVYSGTRKAQKVKEQAQVLRELVSATAESKTRTRDADSFRAFVKTQAEKADTKNVYVSSEQMGEVLQQLGLNVEKVRAIAPEIAEQLENPVSASGDITIPIETYLTQVSNTDLGNALEQHVRLEPDGFSLAEAEAFEEMRPELVEIASQEIDRKAEEKKAFDAEVKEIEDRFSSQLKEAAPHLSATEQSQAKKIVSAMVATAATRSNMSPSVVYEQIVSKILSMEGATGVQAALEEVLEQREPWGLTMEDIKQFQREQQTAGASQKSDASKKALKIYRGRQKGVEDKPATWWSSSEEFAEIWASSKRGGKKSKEGEVISEEIDESAVVSTDISSTGYPSYIEAAEALGVTLDELVDALDKNNDSLAKHIRESNGEGEVRFHFLLENEAVQKLLSSKGKRYVKAKEQIRKGEYVDTFLKLPSTKLLQQGPRASWSPETLVMLLSEKSDVTSVLHEFGHGFMSFYTKLAERVDADQRVKDDVQALMDWFGVKDLTEWNRMTLEEQRPYHEQFAYNWELYLFSGKAPSTKLQKIFDKMSAWARSLYVNLVSRLNETYRQEFGRDLPGLTPEVRSVFDRMLASESQIDELARVEGLVGVFNTKPAGMTDEAWVEYQEDLEEARNESIAQLTAAMLRELKWESNARGRVLRKLQGEAKEARNKIKKEVTAEVESRPVSVLRHFLKTGELRTPDGVLPAEEGAPHKFLISAVKALFPSNKERITEEVTNELLREPEYRVERFIRTGEIPPGGKLTNKDREALDRAALDKKKRKIDLDALKKMFKDEPEVWKGLVSKGLTTKGGIHPDTFARLVGETDSRALMSVMEAKTQKLSKAIEKEVDRRLAQVTAPDVDLRALGYGKNGMLSEKGVHPEEIAEYFRNLFPEEAIFTSADRMINALLNARSDKDEINALTDKRMIEENSEMLDAKSVDEKVRLAIHNKVLAKVVSIEHKFLSNATAPANLLRKAAKKVAHDMLQKIKVAALEPVTYSKQANRSSSLSAKAMRKGDLTVAARAKQAQMLQSEAYTEALHLKNEITTWTGNVKRYQKDAAAKRIGDKGIEQIRAILYRFGLTRIAPTQAEIDARRPLMEHLLYLEDLGYIGLIDIVPDFIKDESVTGSYAELTVSQFYDLMQTIKALDKLGQTEVKERDLAYEEGIARASENIANSIRGNVRKPKARKVAQTRLEKNIASGKSFAWYNMALASLARIFDGDLDNGVAFRELIVPANKAGDLETKMRTDAGARLEEIFQKALGANQFSFKYLKEKIYVKELEGTPGYEDGRVTRGTLFSLALNMGNDGNFKRLIDGYGWSPKQALAAASHLTAAELSAVQDIWNYYETFRPLIAENMRRREGREPKWTVARPLTIRSADGKDVHLAGGHFPIRYDTEGVIQDNNQVDLEGVIGDPMEEIRRQVVTAHGFEMDRTEAGAGKPLLLDPSTIFIGINEVIHDIAWRDTLIRANKIIRSSTFKNAVLESYGSDVYNQFTRWVYDVAVGNQVLSGMGAKLVSLGQNISFSRMAYSMTTLVKQPLGLIQSIPWLGDGNMRVGASLLMDALTSYATDVQGTHNFIADRSVFMKNRGSTMLRDLNELRNVLHGESTLWKKVKVNGFALIARAQSIVDAITWMAAYNKNASLYGERQAVQIADQAVKSSQGSGLLHDMPASMREEGAMRIFTAFYSYRNATFNRLMVSGKTKGVLSGEFFAEATTLLILQVMAERLMMEMLSGDEGDEERNAMERTLVALPSDTFGYTTGLLPVVSEFGGLGEAFFPTGDYSPSYRGPARMAYITDAVNLGVQAAQGEFDTALRKALISASGSAFGVPSSQINRTVDGIEAWANEEVDNPVEVPLSLLFGPRK